MARLALGDPAPPFDLPGVDGSSHATKGYAGKPLAVVFSCVHCPYVVAWEDRLNDVARDYDGRAGLLAVNSNAGHLGDSVGDMQARSREKNFAFPFLYDESQEVAEAYGASRTPEVFVFDGDRRLVYHGAIDDSRDEDQVSQQYLRDALDAVLSGKDPAVSGTPPVGCTLKWK